MSADSKSIKFPDKHYIGFQARPSHDEVPLGFMTPDGTDKAAIKRKETVDNWAKGGGYFGRNEAQDKLPPQSFDNKPLIGFKLGRNVRHGYGWGQGNVKWRIEDPRGFELEITSPNLAQIMGFCTIQEGEILEECIWARMGNENILVPVNSDVYENAIKNTERMAKSASLKDLKLGDSVVMHNGDAGIYYGTMYVTKRQNPAYSSGYASGQLVCGDKKRHVFLMQGADGLESRKFFKAMGSPKLSQVFEGTLMTQQEAELDIAKKVAEEGYTLQEASNDYATPLAFTCEKMDQSMFAVERVQDTLKRVEKMLEEDERSHHYHVGGFIDEAVPIFEVNGRTVTISLRDIFDKRQYLPGGVNHHVVTHHQQQVAANPQWYTHYQNQPSHTEVFLDDLVSDPLSGKITTKANTNRHSYYHRAKINPNDYITVDLVPETFCYYQWRAKSAAGQEVTCTL